MSIPHILLLEISSLCSRMFYYILTLMWGGALGDPWAKKIFFSKIVTNLFQNTANDYIRNADSENIYL